ncbi:sugar ABC transporter substrate-binding protein [Elstera cyanobacteriorum]|uniref:Probable sugar-binding periplasmic protein n=1 Tax=Elstera cyanobacteriorum TaxID=2022747 RepID=A0A255Y1E1_9PROT|nr:ABC transporter substrate-binding protein [Elstera cyanobacteriorum]OYQ22474.1 sugar ABC transporter substrate-binding protein [Elstera cyanobacteriorum]GGA02977.1 sugar ABC transporter substrate-binding protein [Elstera cyanobacteriorum]
MTTSTRLLAGLMFGTALTIAGAAQAQVKEVEMVHWWTSGGEAAALNVLKDDLQKKGYSWKDNPIAGGGGAPAMTVLRARLTSGNIPTAVQMLGFDIQEWAEFGVLANLNAVAEKEGWDKVVPQALQRFSKYNGQWVAAPVNVHSTNWVWLNKAQLDKLGGKAPANWDELVALLEKAKGAGIIPIAHGGQLWQDATLFDSVILTTGGGDFYKKAMIDLDPAALSSPTMKTVFERMAVLRSYVDNNFSGRDWNLASAMVIKGEALMQIMGDWAKGEFVNAGKKPDQDFVCIRFPGTQGQVTFNSDQFALFKVGASREEAQAVLASATMNPAFQSAFNVVKGSAPARTDVSDAAFDACGKKAIADLKEANEKGTLYGSMAHGHANKASVKAAMYDVITSHFNRQITTDQAVAQFQKAVAAAK